MALFCFLAFWNGGVVCGIHWRGATRGGDGVDYPVLYSGSQVGSAAVETHGGRTQVEVSCRRDNGGLFRVYLLCEKGEYPLGVLEPRGEYMGLQRTVRTAELQSLGTVWRGEMRMSYAFSHQTQWQPLRSAEEFFQRDALLAREAGGIQGGLWRRERDQRQLAFPYQTDRPFPLATLFCFAQIQTIEGSAYVVYRFDEGGHPVFP